MNGAMSVDVLTDQTVEVRVDGAVVAVCHRQPAGWLAVVGAEQHQVGVLDEVVDVVDLVARSRRGRP